MGELTATGTIHVVESKYWLPIGNIEQRYWSQLADVARCVNPRPAFYE